MSDYSPHAAVYLSPQKKDGEKRYRFSIVLVLRAYGPTIINSDELETQITGKWPKPMRGVTAGELYSNIRSTHFNVNIGIEEREKQKQNAMRAQEQSAGARIE